MSDQEYSIAKISKDLMRVTLNNGATYSVNVGDISKTACWYPTQRIVVKEISDSIKGYTLTNLDTAGPDVCEANKK